MINHLPYVHKLTYILGNLGFIFQELYHRKPLSTCEVFISLIFVVWYFSKEEFNLTVTISKKVILKNICLNFDGLYQIESKSNWLNRVLSLDKILWVKIYNRSLKLHNRSSTKLLQYIFGHSEKTTKIWNNLPRDLTFTK